MTVENSRRRSRKEQKKRNGKDIMYLKTKKLWGKKGDNRFQGLCHCMKQPDTASHLVL